MKSDFKLFFKYVGPSMFGMLVAGSYSIVDTIFIGRGAGEVALAAIAITWPIIMLFWAVGDMFGNGAAVLVAQARGAGNEARARKAFGGMLSIQAVASILLSVPAFVFIEPIIKLSGATPELMPEAVNYSKILIGGCGVCMFMSGCLSVIRNDGSPAVAMWLMVAGLLGNVFLDWIFIFKFGWGGPGAAWATVVAQGFSVLLAAVYFASPLTKLKISLSDLLPSPALVWKIFVTGIPIFGNIFAIIAMLYMHNFQSLKYGAVAGLAAYTAVSCLESLGSMLMTGLAAGIQPLAAYFYGAKNFVKQNRMGNFGYAASMLLGILMMFFCIALKDEVPKWIGLSGEVAELAAHGVLISSTAFIFLGVVRVAAFYYQSTGKIADSSLLIYGDSFGALPLCLFTLPVWFGMDGVWLAMPLSRAMLFAMVVYLWFFKGRRAKKPISEV